MTNIWPWVTLALLGAFHGINPGMGWLFAVALGLQEKKRQAVINALFPIALGHAVSIGLVVAVVALAEYLIPIQYLKIICAIVLFSFGIYKIFRSRHPNWVGMRVNFWDLTLWSFLMASAHGAGLMLVPIFLKWPMEDHTHHEHMMNMTSGQMFNSPFSMFMAVIVHTLSMLIVTGVIAIIVYEKLGLALLRKAWFNLDLIWAFALILAGIIAIIL